MKTMLRGSIYKTVMELGPKHLNGDVLLGTVFHNGSIYGPSGIGSVWRAGFKVLRPKPIIGLHGHGSGFRPLPQGFMYAIIIYSPKP